MSLDPLHAQKHATNCRCKAKAELPGCPRYAAALVEALTCTVFRRLVRLWIFGTSW